MKKISLVLITLLGVLNISYSQPSEGQTVMVHFFKVDKDKMENYEIAMKDYYQKRAQSWIDSGCQYYWELRKVKPSSSDFSRAFNYIALDVLPMGKKNRNNCGDFDSGLSEGMDKIMMEIVGDKDRVYNTRLSYIDGYSNKGKPTKNALWQFFRVFQMGKFNNRLKDDVIPMYKKHSNRPWMHGMQREPIPGGDGVNEWNYLITYSTDSKKQNGVNPKMWNNLEKKWGNGGEIREMRNNLETTLITYAASK